jgi:hypothetical protein
VPGLVDTPEVAGGQTARLELRRSCDELEDSNVPPHPGRKVDQEGDLALRMVFASQLDEGGGLSPTGRCLEHDSMASREEVVQSSPLLHLLGLRTLLVQTEQPQIDDRIVAQPSRPVRDDLSIGGKSALDQSFVVGSGEELRSRDVRRTRPTLSGIWRVAMISSRDITIRSQPYSFFISACHFSTV